MVLKPGLRISSTTSTVQVIVVKAPGDEVDLRCGGLPMTDVTAAAPDATVQPGFEGETPLGKRYGTDDDRLLLLVTRGGDGVLTIGDTPLPRKDARALPASD
jgi:hypothetical protein